MEIIVRENDELVKGRITFEHILNDEEKAGKVKLYARGTFEPGTELGYHEHHGECESYFILEGEGIYNDDNNLRPVKAGDTTLCKSGHGHGIKNTGDGPLVIMALIYYVD